MNSKSIGLGILFSALLMASAISLYLASRITSPQSIADKISVKVKKELTLADEYADQQVNRLKRNQKLTLENQNNISFFEYDHKVVVSWSDNRFVPSPASVADTFQLKLIKAGNGDYLCKKWVLSRDHFLISVIPLTRKYTITNSYLKPEWNDRIFSSENITVLEPIASIGFPVCINNVCPFKVSAMQAPFAVHENTSKMALVFIALTILMMVVVVFRKAEQLKTPEVGLAILILSFLIVRWCMMSFNFPNGLWRTELFNPQIFASSFTNPSLGDLLINEVAILIICFYIFRHYVKFKFLRILKNEKWSAWIFSVCCGIAILFAALYPFVVIQTLYNNSSIVLDISQSISFGNIRIVAMICVLVSGICSFLFSHVFIRLLIGDRNVIRITVSFLLAILIFTVLNEWSGQSYLSSLLWGAGYFLVVYALSLYSTLKRFGLSAFAYFVTAVFFYSANGASAIDHFSQIKRTEDQLKFANTFLIDRDYFGEYLLHEMSHKISADAFIETRLISPFLNRDAIRQKIRQYFIPSYFNRYDIQIYIFGSSGEPLNNHNSSTFASLLEIYNKESFATDYEGVYFVSGLSDQLAQRYLVTVPVTRASSTAGYVVLELALKKRIPQSVYPELLVDNRAQQLYRSDELSYAVFSDQVMTVSAGSFNYERDFDTNWLGRLELYAKAIHEHDYVHIAQEDDSDRVAVVSLPETSISYRLANFSFLLVWSLTFVLVWISVYSLINYRKHRRLNYSARIQLFLNLAFFIPLILVSYTTLRLTNQFSSNQLNDEYIHKAKVLGEQISIQLDANNQGQPTETSFDNSVLELAKLTALDINVYDTAGVLLSTSQPPIFENNLLSNFIAPQAFQRIHSHELNFIVRDQLGTLSYFVSYTALKSPSTGKLLGVLGIPFFQSAASLERTRIVILTNILNIFTFIFMVLVVLSYFVSRRLTFPLRFITQTLRRTSLTNTNQPLTWQTDDEIGTMVKEYNQMLFKLSESKAELEQTQREVAWREIAQQVAHEIKNPLTPMKLTLQQLERQLQGGSSTTDKTEKAVSSLLDQVDTLNDIASSFSSFAKMPEPVMQQLDLALLLKRIVELHQHTGNIKLALPNSVCEVVGDEQLLGRTFSNIILNAFQSAVPGRGVQVSVLLEKRESNYLLSFADNGRGMETKVTERIFLPHFTTKKSGSGLGLAIAKQAIEQMQGKIWFETQVGKGTTFFIEMNVA